MIKKKRILGLLAVFVVATGALYYFMFGTSNEGIIVTPNISKTGESLLNEPKRLATQHVTLEHNGIYALSQMPAKDIDIEIYKLTASTTYEKAITVIVSKLPAGQLSQNSGYMLRKSYPDKYIKRTVTVNGRAAEVFVSVDKQEQTVFITHNDKVAVLAFVQRGGDAIKLTKEVEGLLQTFAWR